MAEKTDVPVKAENAKMHRWDPFDLFESLQEEMARIWGQTKPLAPWGWSRPVRQIVPGQTTWMPRVDVFEKNGTLMVKAELPGISKDDLNVTIEEGDLVIRGERKAESEVKEENYYRMERSYGSFYRSIPLPDDTKTEEIQATFADGVLQISIPRPAGVTAPPQKIPIT